MNGILRRALLLLVAISVARAQPVTPAPLVNEAASQGAAAWVMAEGRADSALQSGFPAIATELYREALADAALPAEARYRITLSLVTALLDTGDIAAAERELAGYNGPKDSTFQLRTGLVAAHARRLPAARTALAEVNEEDLPAPEMAWWYFLQAQIAEIDGDMTRTTDFLNRAISAATTPRQRARFELAQAHLQLLRGASEDQLPALRANMERYAGERIGYHAARAYATALAVLNRRAEAQAVLQRQLAVVPANERNESDQFRLMLGTIAGESSNEGRSAFRALLRDALRPETQRTALYALARGARTPAEREELRRTLSQLISATTLHPIIEDLLLVRAQTALEDNDYTVADESARNLLDRYPGSPLKADALRVRLAVAWEQKRFRMTAELASQLRSLVPPSRERSELGLVLAESFFRAATLSGNAGDYQSAAEAYEALLHESPLVVPAGELIFQRVLSDVRAGRLTEAARLLDEMSARPALDPVNRWQAEWNLVREMQVRGQLPAAQARVDKLVTSDAAAIPDELRIRLMWLRARLSYDNVKHEAAVAQSDELIARLATSQVEAPLKTEVASTAQLLKAQALLELKRDAEGEALLAKLRAEHPKSKAAVYSYVVQAERQAQRGEFAAAQLTLRSMADNNRESEFAPLALYESAVYAERQGLKRNFEEAFGTLEEITQRYPNDELVFYARLRQGDLLRKLNDFGPARLFYETLLNNFRQHPDILLAQLALGDTLFAQGTNTPANYNDAAAIFDRLRDLATAPIDLRVEAGYKWGFTLLRRGETGEARKAFWSVVDSFLLDQENAKRLESSGRFWLARTLLELGQLLEEAGNFDEAIRAYRLIVDHKLGPEVQAQAKLDRFRAGAERGGE